MEQIKIFHEAPLPIFRDVQKATDGDYALVHLLDKHPDYAATFIETAYFNRKEGRPTILDNSAYELGEAYEESKFVAWIESLNPDIYVVPDMPGDAQGTLDEFSDWCRKYDKMEGLKMGVLQGKNPHEAVNCFKALRSLGADIIGIPFLIGRHFEKAHGCEAKMQDLVTHRNNLVKQIHDICEPGPIHLLGVAAPQEGMLYKELPWVESVDTSNPIVHGIFEIKYNGNGLDSKRPELLADLIHFRPSIWQQEVIAHNITRFREMWQR